MIISFVFLIFVHFVVSSHFRGGMISWRPATNGKSILNTTRTIIIDQRYAWSRSASASSCTSSTITSFGLIGENTVSVLKCKSSVSTCTNVQYTTDITTFVPCTDYNTVLGMSFGQSSTALNLTVRSSGVVLGYFVTGAWLTLQLTSGGWSMMTYINMKPRPDNALINSSPTSSIPPVVYVPADSSLITTIDIPMNDVDGDDIECRFAKGSNTLGGVSVDECYDVCKPLALPSSTVLSSNSNTCSLKVTLPAVGYYAVAVQIEDYITGTSILLSSVPLQFLILTYDASNPVSSCTSKPVITSIPPDLPAPGDNITIEVGVTYRAMVIAESGCNNDTETSITNFITSSPPGMLKTNLPFVVTSTTYAINLTWTPTIDQLGQTFTFCAVAVDINYYTSDQYCFDLFVGPKITTTTTTTTTSTSTTSTTSTSTTSTTSTTSVSTTSTTATSATTSTTTSVTSTTATETLASSCNNTPALLGLGLGLGLPLLLLSSLLAFSYLCRCCPRPLRSIIRHRYGHRDDMYCQHCKRSVLFDDPQKPTEWRCTTPDETQRYRNLYLNNNEGQTSSPFREQYIRNSSDQPSSRPIKSYSENEHLLFNTSFGSASTSALSGPSTTTITSFLSPSIISLPSVDISHASTPAPSQSSHHQSFLMQAFAKQYQ